jgi:hypothetical protein
MYELTVLRGKLFVILSNVVCSVISLAGTERANKIAKDVLENHGTFSFWS